MNNMQKNFKQKAKSGIRCMADGGVVGAAPFSSPASWRNEDGSLKPDPSSLTAQRNSLVLPLAQGVVTPDEGNSFGDPASWRNEDGSLKPDPNSPMNFRGLQGRAPLRMAGGGVAGYVANEALKRREREAMGAAPEQVEQPPQPAIAPAQPQPIRQTPGLKPIRKGLTGALMGAMGFREGGMVHGPGTGTSDEVLTWLSNGEGVLPAKTVRALGGPEAVHDLIEDTTGKRPSSGLRAGGNYAEGAVPDEGWYGGVKRRVNTALDAVQGAAVDPVGTAQKVGRDLSDPQSYAGIKTRLEGNPLDDPMMGMGVGSIASKGAVAKAARGGLWGKAKSLVGGGAEKTPAPAPAPAPAPSTSAAWSKFDAPPPSRDFQSGIRQDIVKEVPAGGAKGIDVTESVLTRSPMDGLARAGDQSAARAANVSVPIEPAPGLVVRGREIINSNPVKTGIAATAATAGAVRSLTGADDSPIKTPPPVGVAPTAVAAVDPAQTEQDAFFAKRGIRVDRSAPKLGMVQANDLSRQSVGLGEAQRLDYGPNAEVVGSSTRADGKLNNFTGIGNGQNSVSDERYNQAQAVAASERRQLAEATLARASSGDRGDLIFAQSQAAGIPGLAAQVENARRMKLAESNPLANALVKQQIESDGKAEERGLVAQALAQDRQEKNAIRRDSLGIAEGNARRAEREFAIGRGDTKLKQFESQLKDKHTVDGKLDAASYSKERDYITQALADKGFGLGDADEQLFRDSQEAYAAGAATPRFNWAKSLVGEGVDAPRSIREGAYKSRRTNSLTGELELQRGDGAWIPASRVYGGGLFGGNPDLNRKRIVDTQIDTPKRGV